MFSIIRKRFTFANVAMTLALVFAMSGGAYAAKKYLITSTKQISPKVLKQLKGAKGAEGARGPAGPQGPQGVPGSNGLPGDKGAPGKDGVSVTSTESKSKIGPCEAGGSEFTSASGKTFACNGEPGEPGEPGETGLPCTATGVMPKGKTETGQWAITDYSGSAGEPVYATVSFPCPLESSLGETEVHFICASPMPGCETSNPACPGTLESPAKPAPAVGHLCIFLSLGQNVQEYLGPISPFLAGGAGPSGALLRFKAEAQGGVVAVGTWAVTAK